MAEKKEKPAEQAASIDVTQTKVKMHLDRPRPGEEDFVWVSNGKRSVQIKKGVDVEVPYWAWMILKQSMDAQEKAYRYEVATEKRALS